MTRQLIPYLLPLFVAAVTSLTLAIYAWRRRTIPGAMAFIGLTLAVAVWSLGYIVEIASPELSQKIFWAKVEYLGIVNAGCDVATHSARHGKCSVK